MLLSREIRHHLATVFNIPFSGVTEIRDQEVITDGRTMNDLEAISAEKMAEYVGSTDSFARLFELTVAKAHSELNPPVGVIKASEPAAPVEPAPAKKVRKAKAA